MQRVNKTSDNLENENLEKLRKVFPEFVKDGLVDFDALKTFFEENGELPKDQEKYGLNWAGKSNAFRAIKTPTTGTLTPDEKESKDFENTENLFIEGDNLEVLKLLQKHYREKIKMIYIDPPYNTGKDFIYKDNFREDKFEFDEKTGVRENGVLQTSGKLTQLNKGSARYHSDWLTMMYPRLFLARNLLKDDGVIFISIDDNEVSNLRSILDEIYGEENFIGEMVVIRAEGGGLAKQMIKGHDYLLVYSKDLNSFDSLKRPKDIRGKTIEKDGIEYWLEEDWLRKEFGKYGTCTYEEIEKYKGIEKKNEIDIGIQNGIYQLIKKNDGRNIVARLRRVDQDGTKFYSIIKHLSADGIRDLQALGLEKYFDFPKPVSLLKEIIKGATLFTASEGEIILDFFAGSGATAQAVMDLNAEDSGNRKWICVQLDEETDEKSEARKAGFENIAQIARERIRRAGEKIGKVDIGFKALKLTVSNYRENEILTDEGGKDTLLRQEKLLIEKPLIDGFDEKAVVYEILIKEGFDLNSEVAKQNDVWVVIDGERKIVILFAEKVYSDGVEKLGLNENDLFICFDSALDDTTKTNILRRKFKAKVI